MLTVSVSNFDAGVGNDVGFRLTVPFAWLGVLGPAKKTTLVTLTHLAASFNHALSMVLTPFRFRVIYPLLEVQWRLGGDCWRHWYAIHHCMPPCIPQLHCCLHENDIHTLHMQT